MSGPRILRAAIVAALAALVFQTHVFVAFHPVRVKVVQASIPAVSGLVRATTAGLPRTTELRPPFALIARVKAPAGVASRIAIAVDGVPVCERDVAGGAARRIDCAVAVPWSPAAEREVTFRGPQTPWALEYLELATHHGNTTGGLTLFVLPGASSVAVRPAWGWTFVLWIVLAGIVAFLPPHALLPRVRLVYRIVAGLVVVLLAVIQCAEWISSYRLVIATDTFAMCLALLLAPRLWTAGRWLARRASQSGRRWQSVVGSGLAPFFEAHPAWRPKKDWVRTAWHWAAPALVVSLFCAPLFVNLREPDVRSDEAIYSYSVERILDTGEWLTPRSIPTDDPFLEKPPLKAWLVAGGMRVGLLPKDERGLRWLDALFGAAGFLYVYVLGRRLAGPLCGVTAVFVLFTLNPLVFDHGLRTNGMEAALFLCYCGGVYHFVRWVEAGPQGARGHAAAVCAYFFLGFMTKFVAAFFLPIVCAVALAVRPGGWTRLRSGWRDWVVPGLLAVALAAPWFIYESVREPADFWRTILGAHVFKRFTASLDPNHLHPWPFYFVQTWKELRIAGTAWVTLAGIASLVATAVWRKPWLPRVVLIWGVLPVAVISIGTSKLLHYAYPFWPAVGLAAGLIVAQVVRAIDGPPGVAVASWLSRLAPRRARAWFATDARRRLLIAFTVAAVAAAAWTAVRGPFDIAIGSTVYFRNTTVLGPLLVACGLLLLGGHATTVVRLVVTAGLLALIPVSVYTGKLAHIERVDHPVRALRDCMASVRRTGVKTGSGVLGVHADILQYSVLLLPVAGGGVEDQQRIRS